MKLDLTVATFNIRNGLAWDRGRSWPFRRSSTAAVLGLLDADIVGLQEVYAFQRRYLLHRNPGYRAVGSPRGADGRGEACPVLARSPRTTIVSTRTRWFGDRPEEAGQRLPGASFPRIATWATVDVDGVRIDVANAHLDEHRPSNRARSTAQLAVDADPDRPTIVMGDLNAIAEEVDTMAGLTDAGFTLVEAAGGTAHGWRGGVDHLRIDHVAVRAPAGTRWQVRSAEVVTACPGGRLPSDHWPFRAALTLHL